MFADGMGNDGMNTTGENMKKTLLLVASVLLTVILRADYAQKMPDFAKSKKPVRTLVEVTAVKVSEPPAPRGVIAIYKAIYAGKTDWNTPTGIREGNTNGQLIFITGLDHDIVTDRCFLFHRNHGGSHLLFVWTAGTATVELNGEMLRLRKYTVEPLMDEPDRDKNRR